MPRAMTSEEIRAFLSHGTRTAKLATSGPSGQPHVMPVWFALDGEELVFTTWGDSVKGRNLRRNPRRFRPLTESPQVVNTNSSPTRSRAGTFAEIRVRR